MGFLDRFKQEEVLDIETWHTLEQHEQLDELVRESDERPVVIFKHSTRCGTSAMAKWQLERDWDFEADELSFYFLDLIRHRALSNEIADRFGVTHQSPQVLLLHRGEVIFHTSHHRVGVPSLRSAVAAAAIK